MSTKGMLKAPFGIHSNAYYLWLALVTVLVLPIAFVVVYLRSEFIPAYSAETNVETLNARVGMAFYLTSNNDSGRYLTVQRPVGKTELKMEGLDWAHNARTSVYVTPDSRLVILGVQDDDYVLSSTFTRLNAQDAAASENWGYLGAFDFVNSSTGRSLRFFTPDKSPECIPMNTQGPFAQTVARLSARRTRCPEYWDSQSRSGTDPAG